ncbi:MAG: MFS transporter [Bradyrhizobiaceae bacterium]|nr:MFS transporter [Bradyrhizobiaceae bacterium]
MAHQLLNWRLNAVLAGLTLLTPVTIHLFFPVIPVLKADFGLSDALAQLTFSVGVVALAFSTLVYGALGDRYGRRPVLLAGLTLFLLGSVITALVTSFAALLAGRLVQAVGAGCGITLARAIARDIYGAEGLVKAIAYLTLCFALGGLTAPGIGGIMVDYFGWRSVFALASVAGLAAITGTCFVIPKSAAREPADRSAPMTAGLLELMHYPRFCALVVQTGCSTGTFLTLATASSVFMKELLHRPATEFGFYFSVMPIGFIIGTVISTQIANRASIEWMVLVGSGVTLAAVAVQSILLLLGPVTPLVLFVPGAFITCAQGLSLPFAQAGAMATVPRLGGTAAGIGVFMQNFMGAGVAQIYGMLADGTSIPLVQTTVAIAILGLLSALLAFRADQGARWLQRASADGGPSHGGLDLPRGSESSCLRPNH